MLTRTALFVLLTAAGSPLHAGFLPSASFGGTTGTNNYYGTSLNVSLDLPLGAVVGGGYDMYKSDSLTGTSHTFRGMGGWRADVGSLIIKGSVTPDLNGYKNNSVGFDGSVRLLRFSVSDEPEEKPLKLYALFGYERAMHTDGQTLVPVLSTSGVTVTQPRANEIVQNDYMGGARLQLFGTGLTAKVIKTQYNENTFLTAKRVKIEGISAYQQGYPDQTVYLRLQQDVAALAYVFGSYSNVRYKFGSVGSADSLTAGVGASLKIVSASLEYNRYIPASGDPSNFYSFGFSLGF